MITINPSTLVRGIEQFVIQFCFVKRKKIDLKLLMFDNKYTVSFKYK